MRAPASGDSPGWPLCRRRRAACETQAALLPPRLADRPAGGATRRDDELGQEVGTKSH